MIKQKKKQNKRATPYIWSNPRTCVACWKCIESCPQQVIEKVQFLWHKHIVFRDSENCSGCKRCIKTCPNGVFNEF